MSPRMAAVLVAVVAVAAALFVGLGRAGDDPTTTDVRTQSAAAALGRLIGAGMPSAPTNAALQRTLEQQHRTVRQLTRNGDRAIAGLRAQNDERIDLRRDLQALLRLGDQRDRQIKRALRALPAAQREAAATIKRLGAFVARVDPLVRQLGPVVRELPPTMAALRRIGPDARALLRDLSPVIQSSRRGLPAISQITDALRPVAQQLDPLLRQINPALKDTSLYPDLIPAFLAHAVAVTQTRAGRTSGGPQAGAFRTLAHLQPDPPVRLTPKKAP